MYTEKFRLYSCSIPKRDFRPVWTPVFKCSTVLNRTSRVFFYGTYTFFAEYSDNSDTFRLNSMEVEEEEVNVSDSPNMGQRSMDGSIDKKRC